jgi:hypothetical protein
MHATHGELILTQFSVGKKVACVAVFSEKTSKIICKAKHKEISSRNRPARRKLQKIYEEQMLQLLYWPGVEEHNSLQKGMSDSISCMSRMQKKDTNTVNLPLLLPLCGSTYSETYCACMPSCIPAFLSKQNWACSLPDSFQLQFFSSPISLPSYQPLSWQAEQPASLIPIMISNHTR